MPFLILLWKYRKLAFIALAGLAMVGVALYLRHAGYVAGEAADHVLWVKDTAARDKATRQAIDDARAKADAAMKANEEVENDYQAKLAASERSRDQYVGLFQRARDQVRAISAREGESISGAIAAGEARGAERIGVVAKRVEAACERIPAESRSNADQLDSLIAEVKPQM